MNDKIIITESEYEYWIEDHTKVVLKAEHKAYIRSEVRSYVSVSAEIVSQKTREELGKIDLPIEKIALVTTYLSFIDRTKNSNSSLKIFGSDFEKIEIPRKTFAFPEYQDPKIYIREKQLIEKYINEGRLDFVSYTDFKKQKVSLEQAKHDKTYSLELDLSLKGFHDIKVRAKGDKSYSHFYANFVQDKSLSKPK